MDMDTSACSRCGATDNRHSAKCLQAMALGWAMGVEERPRLGPVRVERDDDEIARIGEEYMAPAVQAYREEIDQLHGQMDVLGEKLIAAQRQAEHWQRKYDQLAPLYDALLAKQTEYAESPANVTPERLAEIQREVDALNASEHLEVEVHDELNVTVTPKEILRENVRDLLGEEAAQEFDTDESYPDHGPEDDAAAAMGLPAKTTGTLDEAPPAPEATPSSHPEAAPAAPAPEAPHRSTDEWAAYVKALRTRLDMSKSAFAKLVGCSPQTLRDWEAGNFVPGPKWQQRFAEIDEDRPPAPTVAETFAERAQRANASLADQVRPHVEAFVNDLVDRTAPEDAYLTSPELLKAYAEWRLIKGAPELSQRQLGLALTAMGIPKRQLQTKHVEPGQPKPMAYWGCLWKTADSAAPELDPREKNKRDVEEVRALMAQARNVYTEEIPTPGAEIPPGPDELAIKLAQLKTYGIGGERGVSKAAALTAVEDLHPTGNEVWTSVPGEALSDDDLRATAYQLLVKCADGLPEQYGYDYKEDVLATAGFVAEDVEAALRNPQHVEIRPESWDREKRYPVLGFTRGDVRVILGMRIPNKPRVIAAYWTSLLQADTYRVSRHGGGGSKKATGLPTTPATALSRLTGMGCEIEGDPLRDKTLKVNYKGQDLGKITCGKLVPKATVQSDYQRTLRKMQAIDRREGAKASA